MFRRPPCSLIVGMRAIVTLVADTVVKVRAVEPDDIREVCDLVAQHNGEAGPSPNRPNPRTLKSLVFGRNSFVFCEVAEDQILSRGSRSSRHSGKIDGAPLIGHAIWHDCFSTDDGSRGGYLVDLFVVSGRRREGVATQLIKTVCRKVKARGGTHLWWATMPKNASARRFYAQFGASDDRAHAHAIYGETFLDIAKADG